MRFVPYVSSVLVLRAKPRFPHDETYFQIAHELVLALGRLRLHPRRRSASRWSFICPICRELPASGTFLALPTGAVVSCRHGCSRKRIRRVIESVIW